MFRVVCISVCPNSFCNTTADIPASKHKCVKAYVCLCATRTYKINPNSSRPIEFIAVHEMLHDIQNSPEYAELRKFVEEYAKGTGNYAQAIKSLENTYRSYYEKNNLNQDNLDIGIEATNDMVAQALGNQEFLNSLLQTKPSVFTRIYNWIKDMGTKIFGTEENKFLLDLKKKFEKAYNSAYQEENNNINYSKNNDSIYGAYCQIETGKDIFKGIDNIKELQKKAYNYILNGNDNFENIIDVIDNKNIEFKRVSAREYVYGRNDKNLQGTQYSEKMRIAPSIEDLIKNADIKYHSPLTHKNNLFQNGYNNYQGQLAIDNNIFRYIVRVVKTKNDGSIFYDLSLELLGQKIEPITKYLEQKVRH